MFVSGGRTPTERCALEWAREAEKRGAGEILLTSMDRDGTGIGFDCELTAAVAQAVSIPVIASGGAGSVEHFIDVFRQGQADAALAASIFHFGIHDIGELKQRIAAAGHTHEVAMLIPSIDLMGGKVVQLVQGAKKALEFDSFEPWVNRFAKYPLVQLIDLDAAMRQGNNRELVRQIAGRLPCQVGGGIRTVQDAQEMLACGAKTVIIGSSLVREGQVDVEFAQALADAIGIDKLVFALDSKGGKVTVAGWKEATPITALDMMRTLEPYCSAFLYTHVDTEGMMKGIPLEVVRELRAATKRRLIAAGGIRSREEVDALDAIRVDAVVGMAIYTGAMEA